MNEMPPRVCARFLQPGHAGRLAGACVCTGRAGPGAGDGIVEVDLQWANGVIAIAMFRAFGCPATIAVADWVCAALVGRTMAAGRGLTTQDIESELALPPAKRYCAVVVLDAVAAALAASRATAK